MEKPKIITKQVEIIDHAATGAAMRKYRTELGLSLREAARRMDISAAYLSDLERGRRNWTRETLNKWMAVVTKPGK